MTRDDDRYITLSDRADVANNNSADLFISVHINAQDGGTNANGYSIHCLGQSSRKGNDLFSKNLELCKRENSVIKLEEDYSTKYQGFDESIWPGYETLRDGKIYIDFRTPLYDYHIWGNTATKDLQYLDSFKPNYEVIKMQYVLVGKIEGRPYRYCKDKESKTLKAENESQAVAVASKWDFSAHFYCKNKKDGQVYLIP